MNHDAVELLRTFSWSRRAHLGLSQVELSRLSGLSTGWVGNLEAGRQNAIPRDATLQKLASGLVILGETQGTLFNFFKLVLALSFTRELVLEVATGQRSAGTAMQDAVQGIGTTPIDMTPPKATRSDRLDRALAILRADLDPEKYHLVAVLLDYLYRNRAPGHTSEPP